MFLSQLPPPIIHFPECKRNSSAALMFRTKSPTFPNVHRARSYALVAESPENSKLTTGNSTGCFASSTIVIEYSRAADGGFLPNPVSQRRRSYDAGTTG
jgi:hypothetical protein